MQYLGKELEIVIDRPLGSKHPKYGFIYGVNYGYLEGVKAPDGEDLDAYYLGVGEPVKAGKGKCVAIIHRAQDDDDKLVVVVNGFDPDDETIKKLVHFQEQWFDHEVIR